MKNHMHIMSLLLLLSLSIAAQGNEGDYALLIQASPPDAGTVAPGMGVHKIQMGQTVPLSAKPKQGYRFLYWLGDVASTSGVDTTISIDSPKLVVAVFAREDFEEELPNAGIVDGQHAPGGRGGVNPIQSPSSVNIGGRFDDGNFPFIPSQSPIFPNIPDIPNVPDVPDDNVDDIPVPGDDDDIPVPGDNEIPEPATIVLFGLGSGFLLRRRKKM
ncbi:MAG: PEP-CTERM sorting domain-containing protein [Planctomycetota bacterium]|jgi:hypothetical protein